MRNKKRKASGPVIAASTFPDDVVECLAELDERQGVVSVFADHSSISSASTTASSCWFKQQQNRIFFNSSALNAQLEISRHNYANKLSRFLLESCTRLRIASFERWAIDSKMEERVKVAKQTNNNTDDDNNNNNSRYIARRANKNKRHKPHGVDVWIPSMPHVADKSTQHLMEEIIISLPPEDKDKKSKAKSICIELCTMSMKYARALEKQARQQNANNSKIQLEKTSAHKYSLIFQQPNNKKTFCVRVNAVHYQKLFTYFSSYSNDISLFHLVLFVLILRYSTMAGGQQCCLKDSRGGGMQGAIHREVFEFLKQHFFQQTARSNIFLECFASPLNTVAKHTSGEGDRQVQHYYCSTFPDIGEVDVFHSSGDFFQIPVGSLPDGCCCEANPPFAPVFMTAMANRIEEHLLFSSNRKQLLTFVVVVPTTHTVSTTNINAVQKAAQESFLLLLKSKFLKKHIILKSKEHGYLEASQHMRSTQYKESQYDTSVFLLQSSANSLSVNDENSLLLILESGIRKAFASKHNEELMERRKDKEQESTFRAETDENLEGAL